MKHIQLFEEFIFDKFKNQTPYQLEKSSPYEMIKPLPTFGYCKVDEEESIAIQVALLQNGYQNFPDYVSLQKYYHNVINPKGKNLIVWNGKRMEISVDNTFKDIESYDIVNNKVYYGYDGSKSPPPFIPIKFEDYFRPKPGYEGYFHGKQYGI
jgi:hypothetical protein